MKKFFISLIVVAFFALVPTSAQINFGVKGGVNSTNMHFDENVFKSSHRYGWFVGPTLKIGLPVGIGADISALFEQKKVKINDETVSQKSLVIPLNARLSLGVSNTAGIYFAAGPQFGFNVGDKKFEWDDKNGEIHNTFQLKKSTLSINLGAGLTLSKHLELGVTYNFDISKTGEASFKKFLDAATDKQNYEDDTKSKTWAAQLCIYF